MQTQAIARTFHLYKCAMKGFNAIVSWFHIVFYCNLILTETLADSSNCSNADVNASFHDALIRLQLTDPWVSLTDSAPSANLLLGLGQDVWYQQFVTFTMPFPVKNSTLNIICRHCRIKKCNSTLNVDDNKQFHGKVTVERSITKCTIDIAGFSFPPGRSNFTLPCRQSEKFNITGSAHLVAANVNITESHLNYLTVWTEFESNNVTRRSPDTKLLIKEAKSISHVIQRLTFGDSLVDAGDPVHLKISLRNNNTRFNLFNVSLIVNLSNQLHFVIAACWNLSGIISTTVINSTLKTSQEFLAPNRTVFCSINSTVSNTVMSGSMINVISTATYYVGQNIKTQSNNIYSDVATALIRVKSINVSMSSLSMPSTFLAGQNISVLTTVIVPEGQSIVSLRWTILQSARKRRATWSNSQLAYFMFESFQLTGSNALQFNRSTKVTNVDNSTATLFIGIVKNGKNKLSNGSLSFIKVIFGVKLNADPVLLSGKSVRMEVVSSTGQRHSILFHVVGPLVFPSLNILKNAMVISQKGVAQLVYTNVSITHNGSLHDAEIVQIEDSVNGMIIVDMHSVPKSVGKIFITGTSDKTTITMSNVFLRAGSSVSLIYKAKFSSGSEIQESKNRATVKWKSLQVNSPVFGPISSTLVCLKRKTVANVQYYRKYGPLALAIFLGILSGVLITLLVLASCRKTAVARKYILEQYPLDSDTEKGNKATDIQAKELVKKLRSENPKVGVRWPYVVLEDGREAAELALLSDVINVAMRLLLVIIEAKAMIWACFMERYSSQLHSNGETSLELHKQIKTQIENFIRPISEQRKTLEKDVLETDLTVSKKEAILAWCNTVSISLVDKGESLMTEIANIAKMNTGARKLLFDDLAEFMKNLNQEMVQLKFSGILFLECMHAVQVGQLHLFVNYLSQLKKIADWIMKKTNREFDIMLRKRLISMEVINVVVEELQNRISDAEKEHLVQVFAIVKETESNMLPKLEEMMQFESMLAVLQSQTNTTSTSVQKDEKIGAGLWLSLSRKIPEMKTILEQSSDTLSSLLGELMTIVILRVAESRDRILASVITRAEDKVREYYGGQKEDISSQCVESHSFTDPDEEESLYDQNERRTFVDEREDVLQCLHPIAISLANLVNTREMNVNNDMDLVRVSLGSYIQQFWHKFPHYQKNQASLVLHGKVFLKISLCSIPCLSSDTARVIMEHWLNAILKIYEAWYLEWKWTVLMESANPQKRNETQEQYKTEMSNELALNFSKDLEEFLLLTGKEEKKRLEVVFKKFEKGSDYFTNFYEKGLEECLQKMLSIGRDSYKEELVKTARASQDVLVTAEALNKIPKSEKEKKATLDHVAKERLKAFNDVIKQLQKSNETQIKGTNVEETRVSEAKDVNRKLSLSDGLGDLNSKCMLLFGYEGNADIDTIIFHEDHLKKHLEMLEKQALELQTEREKLQKIKDQNISLLSDLAGRGKIETAVVHELIRDTLLCKTVEGTKQTISNLFGQTEINCIQEMFKYISTLNPSKPTAVLTPTEVTVRKRKGKGILAKRKNTVLPSSYPDLPPLRGSRKRGFNLREAIS